MSKESDRDQILNNFYDWIRTADCFDRKLPGFEITLSEYVRMKDAWLEATRQADERHAIK